jgi:pectinesterase
MMLAPLLFAATLVAPTLYEVRPVCGATRALYTRIQSALDAAARDKSDDWITIRIAAGIITKSRLLRGPAAHHRGGYGQNAHPFRRGGANGQGLSPQWLGHARFGHADHRCDQVE